MTRTAAPSSVVVSTDHAGDRPEPRYSEAGRPVQPHDYAEYCDPRSEQDDEWGRRNTIRTTHISMNALGSANEIPRGGDGGGLDCPKRRNGRVGLPAPAERLVKADQRFRLGLLGRDILLLEV